LNVFEFRKRVVEDYERFSRSFSKIKTEDIAHFVDAEYRARASLGAFDVGLAGEFADKGEAERDQRDDVGGAGFGDSVVREPDRRRFV